MFDKQTESEWLHVTAECVMGPLKGKSLDMEPARLMTWTEWKTLHPQTTVMATRRKWSRASHEKKDFAKAALRPKLGLNVVVEHESKLYPYSVLEPARVINDRFQETPLAAVYAPQAACAVAWVRRVGDWELTLRPQPVNGNETASGNRERLRLRDEQTGSLWDPLSGKAISGPLKGKQLSPLVAIPIRVSRYRGLYPDGQVYAQEERPVSMRMVFPGKDWQEEAPESQAVDSRKLEAAVRYLEEHSGSSGVKRLVVVRNGRVIWKGAQSDRRQKVWSVAKAITSTAQGLLIEDGKCTLETLAKDFSPHLARQYGGVTLRHFATMTSGYDGVGGWYDCDAQKTRCDANALADPAPPVFAPGTKFMYWDEAMMQYGHTLTKIAGEPLPDYLKRRIFDPIGVKRIVWQTDETGKVPNWTGGLEISASDLARFGHLFLNHGDWNGRQLITETWVREATRVQVPASLPAGQPTSSRLGSGVYGYHWWPNGMTPDGKRRWPDAPIGTYARSGYNNNDLFVIPAWKMVIVRLGLDQRDHNITTAEYNEFLKLVGEAIGDSVATG